ncbi:bifunctional hydroxymethylpyrimidine kinase/phosphomethylpyrimidine kinase [Curtobacterium sp. 'Ferrero']|uniref:bifunctional hydroxymethylpyrimidine kinase/phosphomethylpyrimidine kinase n=1 Tax=Curtobacterium sp. 'Ferrero' TaxID=2033654 RepID=UPI000BD9D65B|nr:bifunctional hydroxymethylpyrimidine kinase/phosphomethylpyrimidine kinase [Curtobacterium sp. 'Ferrero']PCN47959.1 bifunctional hydroxymethylpyrimidine kinase/phosphomethylpyrimidine kinase [Curtobacterium sp. 'Ferrero']
MTAVPRVLSIAGTDPTGGAGMQADLKAIAAHDGYGMGVVTALVAQNTRGVRSVHVPDTRFLRAQLDAVSDDVTIDAVKVGMLADAAVVRTVTEWLAEHRPPVVVVDPVMVATSGDRLLSPDAEAALTGLFAHADLVTPNRAELAVLAGLAGGGSSAAPVERAAVERAAVVARAWDVHVLAKGGHDDGPVAEDVLVAPDGSVRVFTAPRVATTNTHGTGCSLSSAVATLAAQHGDWELAVGRAKAWLTTALEHADALEVGRGHGPVDHGAALRDALPPVRWTDAWWDDAADTLEAVLRCRFLTGLADGTLDAGVFERYLAQDVHYLLAYERHLSALAAATTGETSQAWAAAAAGCAVEAEALHHRRLAGSHADDPVDPVCAGYLAHLQAAADSGSPAVLAAAVLPCFRVYAWVGTRLGHAPEGHPFADWLGAYGDPGFAAASAAATERVEAMAAAAAPNERGRMARAFRTSTAWEAAFFAMPFGSGASAVADAGAGAAAVPGDGADVRTS